MIRALDLLLSSLGLFFGLPVLAVLYVIGLLDTGSPIFRQVRLGRHREPFTLVKYRTMHKATASVASHLADPTAITPFGALLRRTKLDELPQLWNVLKGEMSLVGPRPCLPDQEELIYERQARGVFDARPGITGLAQLKGIDMSTPALLAEADASMLQQLSVPMYLSLIVKTVRGGGSGDGIGRRTFSK